MTNRHYYYLHTNGELIHKPDMPGILEDFAESDLVRDYWPIDTEDRTTLYLMLIDAAKKGARMTRVIELAEKWGADGDDGLIFAERVGFKVVLEEGQSSIKEYIARHEKDAPDNPQVGKGSSPLLALISYAKQANRGTQGAAA